MSDWLTTDEAVELSGYNLQYIRDLIRRKKIKAEKKGGAYWVSRESLFEYMQTAKSFSDKRHGPKPKKTKVTDK